MSSFKEGEDSGEQRRWQAYEQGVEAGYEGADETANPHTDPTLRLSWKIGHAVGLLNREGKSR